MKNLIKPLVVLAMMSITIPAMSNINPAVTIPIEVQNQAEAARLTNRLHEIQAMDIKNMTAPQKRALRKEVKAIKKVQATKANGGVFLSVGAIIVIILLLILLL